MYDTSLAILQDHAPSPSLLCDSYCMYIPSTRVTNPRAPYSTFPSKPLHVFQRRKQKIAFYIYLHLFLQSFRDIQDFTLYVLFPLSLKNPVQSVSENTQDDIFRHLNAKLGMRMSALSRNCSDLTRYFRTRRENIWSIRNITV